jgi:hypothetical protein
VDRSQHATLRTYKSMIRECNMRAATHQTNTRIKYVCTCYVHGLSLRLSLLQLAFTFATRASMCHYTNNFDYDLEAFNCDLANGSIAVLACRPAAFAHCVN